MKTRPQSSWHPHLLPPFLGRAALTRIAGNINERRQNHTNGHWSVVATAGCCRGTCPLESYPRLSDPGQDNGMVDPLFPDNVSYLNVSPGPPSATPCPLLLSLIPTWTLIGSSPACCEESFRALLLAPRPHPVPAVVQGGLSLSGTLHVNESSC